MTTAEQKPMAVTLKKEIMLQVNQRLYDTGIIAQNMYEQAKIKIVNAS